MRHKAKSTSAVAIAMAFVCCPAEANTGTQFATAQKVGTLENNSLTETSGCAAGRLNDNTFWLHNDSGDSARIFAINRAGQNLGVFNLSGASAVDYEDIAMGPGPVAGKPYIYVADIGDNGRSRSSVQVYRMPEPKVGSGTSLSVEKITLRYPDGANNAEALMVDPSTSDLYILTKEKTSKVFRFKAPLKAGQTYTGERVGTLNIYDITGADISVDGSRILASTNNAETGTPRFFLWLRQPGESVATALQRSPYQLLAFNGQLESVCWGRVEMWRGDTIRNR